MASSFPKLPGFVPTQEIDKALFRRVSAQKQEQNRDIKNAPVPLYNIPRQKQVQKPDQTRAFNENYMSTTHDTYKPLNGEEITELYQPDWVKLDRHVLRFNGYFKEGTVESPLEQFRVRKVIIYLYLEDNSISIIEPRQTNSGIPQGPFLKRQKVKRQDGSGTFFTIDDFRIGQDTMIFSKNIRIYDCDQYTREFYEIQGRPQPAPESYVQDNFENKTLNKYVPQKDHTLKDYMEHKLGGGRVQSQKQFLENDRKVLKFYVTSEIPYIMHYYLADDTIDIREVNYQNSGRDPFPLMLKRQKLPRQFSLNQPGQTYQNNFIKPVDIRYGELLQIFGKTFSINGCDEYTQNYYLDNLNIDFPLGSTELPKPKEQGGIQIPPYNGFGDEQDSLGYVYKLVPQPPKKDYFKWVDNQIYLRYRAQLNTDKPEDIDRRFIITYYLNDDSINVYEPEQRNSGITSGKFLEKKKYKNQQNNNQFFTPADLIIGNDVIINSYSFKILGVDEFTRKWYVQNFQ